MFTDQFCISSHTIRDSLHKCRLLCTHGDTRPQEHSCCDFIRKQNHGATTSAGELGTSCTDPVYAPSGCTSDVEQHKKQ